MTEEIVKAENLRKWFPIKMGFFKTVLSKDRLYVRAVDGISFNIKKAEIFNS